MNHARIAMEALRFRLGTLPSAARHTPGVDRAIRVLGETWQAAGLPPTGIDKPWTAGEAARLRSAGGVELLDTLDELVTGITRCRGLP